MHLSNFAAPPPHRSLCDSTSRVWKGEEEDGNLLEGSSVVSGSESEVWAMEARRGVAGRGAEGPGPRQLTACCPPHARLEPRTDGDSCCLIAGKMPHAMMYYQS